MPRCADSPTCNHDCREIIHDPIGTFSSLEKNWPEGKPFYKHLPKAFPFRHQVPAVLVAELNKSLGI